MRTPHLTRIAALAALTTSLLIGGPAVAATPTAAPAATARQAVSAAYAGNVCYSALPSQAHDTLDLIASGGPFPYRQDGVVFQNRESQLPRQSYGYYHEYTVITPGSSTRGARRVITGEAGDEDYYTSDHYATFRLIDFNC